MRYSRSLSRSLASLGLALLLMTNMASVATAANTGPGNGLRVSPVRTDVTIKPGDSQSVVINVTNVTSQTATFSGIVNDFVANSDESGNPVLLLANNAFAPSHSLKRFVQPLPNITINPGQELPVTVVIKVPLGAAGGGYYGAVRFAPASSNPASGVNVSLAGSVGSLILVSVPGKVVEQLSIASFDVRVRDRPNSFFTNNHSIDVVIRLQNEGNIQEQPFGKIQLKNRSNKTIAEYSLNNVQPPGNVLPNSIRKFVIPLGSKVGSFGQYKLEGNFGYGSSGQLLSASTTFYIFPVWLILGFIILVFLIVLLIFVFPKLLKAYNKRVLRKAGRR